MSKKQLKVYKFVLTVALEYFSGYEFPVWRENEWKMTGQFKLDPFLESPSELLLVGGAADPNEESSTETKP